MNSEFYTVYQSRIYKPVIKIKIRNWILIMDIFLFAKFGELQKRWGPYKIRNSIHHFERIELLGRRWYFNFRCTKESRIYFSYPLCPARYLLYFSFGRNVHCLAISLINIWIKKHMLYQFEFFYYYIYKCIKKQPYKIFDLE